MNDQEASERATLESLSKRWIEQGFQVLLQPSGDSIPDFLQKYRPDAILTRANENVIVEVIRKGSPYAEETTRRLKTLVEGQEGWRLEVVYVGQEVDAVKRVQKRVILDALSKADELSEIEPRASLLLMWSAIEAATRDIFPKQTLRPQSPGRVIELLASGGEVTPAEASTLRKLMRLRNVTIHGELDAVIIPADLREMHRIVRQVVERS